MALSVTRAEFLPAASEAAMALRRLVPAPRVLVGEAALRGRPRAAAALGADAIAADALSGMHEARKLVRPAAAAAPPDYFERLGRRTQELRTARDWTQQQLAEAAGLDRTYISGLENGKQNPTLGAPAFGRRAGGPARAPPDLSMSGEQTPGWASRSIGGLVTRPDMNPSESHPTHMA